MMFFTKTCADSELAYAKVYRKKCFECYTNEINDLTASSQLVSDSANNSLCSITLSASILAKSGG